MAKNIVKKDPSETFSVSVNFSDLLASGDTVSSATISAVDERFGTSYSSGADKVIGSTAGTVATPVVSFKVLAGTTNRVYKIKVSATTAASDVLVSYVYLKII